MKTTLKDATGETVAVYKDGEKVELPVKPLLAERFETAVNAYGDAFNLGVNGARYRGQASELLASGYPVELWTFTELETELTARIAHLQTALKNLAVAREMYELGGRADLHAYNYGLMTAQLEAMKKGGN